MGRTTSYPPGGGQKREILEALANIPSEINLPAFLNVGGDSYIMTERIIGLLDVNNNSVKRMVKDLQLSKPRNIINATGGKKQKTVILLAGEIIVLSPFERLTLIKRLINFDTKEILKPVANTKPKLTKVANKLQQETIDKFLKGIKENPDNSSIAKEVPLNKTLED